MKTNLKKLILLVNLGSPEALDVKSIKNFLKVFLSDKRVVNLPRYLWYPILYGIILPIRSKKLLHKYQQIWLDGKGMPLSYYTQQQALQLQQEFDNSDTVVDYAFCYGSRTIRERLTHFEASFTIDELIVLPLYPQYSSSTTAPVFDQLSAYYTDKYQIPQIKFINSFAVNRQYIKILADNVRKYWIESQETKLVVSFHSVPVDLIDNGDSYVKECESTYLALCIELGLDPKLNALLCYQSKFGKAKWVEPATDNTIKSLALSGCKNIVVVCPGFVSDCLETLEEVSQEYRDLFLNNGGKKFGYVPCFNDSFEFINVLKKIIN